MKNSEADHSMMTQSLVNTNMMAQNQNSTMLSGINLNPERKPHHQRKNSETESTSLTYKEVEKKDEEDSPTKTDQIVEYVDEDNCTEFTVTDKDR